MHRDVYSVVTGVYRFMCNYSYHCVYLYLYICACRDVLGTLRIFFFTFCFQRLKTLFMQVELDMTLFFVTSIML